MKRHEKFGLMHDVVEGKITPNEALEKIRAPERNGETKTERPWWKGLNPNPPRDHQRTWEEERDKKRR